MLDISPHLAIAYFGFVPKWKYLSALPDMARYRGWDMKDNDSVGSTVELMKTYRMPRTDDIRIIPPRKMGRYGLSMGAIVSPWGIRLYEDEAEFADGIQFMLDRKPRSR